MQIRHLTTTLRALALAGLLASASLAHAGMGMTRLPATATDGPVTVFYPTAAPEQATTLGPFTLSLAVGAAPQKGNGRLVAMSHGSGGNAWVHADLARALVDAGFVVAMPQHHGDNTQDPSAPGPASWKLRPAEVSRAIDAVGRDARFAPLLALDKVGMYGMSAGGHTALSMAGGRWSPARFVAHCEAHIADDFPACMGLYTQLNRDLLDGPKKAFAAWALRSRFDDATEQAHNDPRIAAVAAGVPAAADFDPASLATPRVPLALVTAGQDRWLSPALHGGAILKACLPRCELLVDLPTAGHGALMSPLPPLANERLRELVADPPGFDRAQMAEVDRRIAAFMRRHLLP
ncbi:MAG TPA: dienelactone hydrolase [Ramlibacter sp.]|nr:dienelactone hydrolase [Ramlibacter sp.]